MPGFDRTGPMGAGPMTGGARGRCYPAKAGTVPADAGGYGYGRGLGLRRGFRGGHGTGWGRGRGFGSGLRWYPYAWGPDNPLDADLELDISKAEAAYTKQVFDAINKRIDELEKKSSEDT